MNAIIDVEKDEKTLGREAELSEEEEIRHITNSHSFATFLSPLFQWFIFEI